jgi:preprotein translocase subunit SecE
LIAYDNWYYPHIKLINSTGRNAVWAWTCSKDITYQKDTDGSLLLTLDFPLEYTHYVIFKGIPVFEQIFIYDMAFRTDPRFETYNSSGYVYKPESETLLLKSRHKTQLEEIKMSYVAPKPAATPKKVEEAPKSNKDLVEAKIRKQIEKKQQKEASLGVYRIGEYLKEEHQWENWLFLGISIVTLLLGCLMLNGALQVRSDFPVIGEYPTVFAWILVVLASLGLLYALYPFLKPAFPELKKITWLTWPKFLGNAIRTFVFIIILTLLFMLYDVFITELLGLII